MTDSEEDTQIVKVYLLDDGGSWQPEGIGLFSIQDEDTIVVKEEARVVLSSRILADDMYRLTDDIILVWSDPALNREVALSFQSRTACTIAMRLIDGLRSSMSTRPAAPPDAADVFIAEEGSLQITPASLFEAHKSLMAASAHPSEFITFMTNNSTIITQLLTLFPEFLKAGDTERMERVVDLIRMTLCVCCVKPTHNVFTALLGTYDSVIAVIRVLEFDKEINPQHVPHLAHIESRIESLQSTEKLPLSPDRMRRVKYVYALGYLRESVAPRVIEDETIVGGALPNHLNKLRHDTFRLIFSDLELMKNLVSNLDEFSIGVLYEIMSSMKTSFFPIQVREDYAVALLESDILALMGHVVCSSNPKARGVIADLVYQIICLIPDAVRLFLASSEEKARYYPVLSLMVSRLMDETIDSVSVVWKDALCVLLIPNNNADFIPFRHAFFDDEFHVFEKILQAVHERTVSRTVIGFLTFCAHHHWRDMAETMERCRKVPRIVDTYIVSLKTPLALRLAALDFLRNICCMSTRFEMDCVIRDGALRSIIDILGGRVSPMLTSAVIGVFNALVLRRSFDALRDVMATKSEQIGLIPGLKVMFDTIGATPPPPTMTAPLWSADTNDEENYLSEIEKDAEAIDQLRPRSAGIDADGAPIGQTLQPSLLSTIAGLCRKRGSDDKRDEDDAFARLLKKRSGEGGEKK